MNLVLYFDSDKMVRHQAHPLIKNLPLSLWNYDNEYVSSFKYDDNKYSIKYINVTDNIFHEIPKIKIDEKYEHITIPYSLVDNNIQNYKIRIAISLFLQNLNLFNISSINIISDGSLTCIDDLFPETDEQYIPHYLKRKITILQSDDKNIEIEFGSGYKHVFNDIAHYYFDPVYSPVLYDNQFIFDKVGLKVPLDIVTGLKLLKNKINIKRYNLHFRSSRMFEHLNISQLQQVHKLLSEIQFKKLSIIVPDFKHVINIIDNSSKKWWQTQFYHIANSEVFGFNDWETDSDHKTVWTEKLLTSFIKSLGKYDVSIKKYTIDGKSFYLYCVAIRR